MNVHISDLLPSVCVPAPLNVKNNCVFLFISLGDSFPFAKRLRLDVFAVVIKPGLDTSALSSAKENSFPV